MTLMKVVFPAPFGPMIPSISFSRNSIFTRLRAARPPKYLVKFSVFRPAIERPFLSVTGFFQFLSESSQNPLREKQNSDHDNKSINQKMAVRNLQLQELGNHSQ